MKKSYFLYFSILALFLCSCFGKSKEPKSIDWETLISQTLKEELIDSNENHFCLFITDNGCSECIIKEYMKIKQDGINIIVIGLFRNKRNFMASTNEPFIKKRFFIPLNQSHNNIATQPIYFIYNQKTNIISDTFYPEPCEYAEVFSYFQKVKRTLDLDETISKETTATSQQQLTTISIQQQEIALTNLQKDKTSTTIFRLTNNGNQPLLITHIDSSCGCTVPTYDKQPVEPGANAEIKVEITPGELGAFHKTIRVFCNTEKGVVSLVVKGMVEQ